MQQAQHQESRWIWPFELVEKIGEGGMGVVYKARYVKDDRLLAVKLLPADVTDRVILDRFERELEILKTLRHPNVVRTFGGVCEDKRRFYAMELIEGGTLEDVLQQRGRLPWEQVVDYGRQMCAALAYAHEQGVVHRDVKPGNFLIGADGRLKLSDFGLASFVAARKITAAGRTMGTYFYMAPEQIRGSGVSAKADLYSLGCVLFELLTGRPPFPGDTPAETLHRHMREDAPRVSALAPDCPASLESLIAALLEKDPEQRPQDALEVARRLEEVTQFVVLSPRRREGNGTARRRAAAARGRSEPPRQPDGSDEPAAPQVARRSRWVPVAALVALAALLWWSLSLSAERGALTRSLTLWIEAYENGAPAVQVAAAHALGELAPASPAALEALVAGVEAEDPEVRRATVEGLGSAGAASRPAIPALKKLQQRDDRPEVRLAAVEALRNIETAPAARSPGRYVLGALFVLAVLMLPVALRNSISTAWQALRRRFDGAFPSSAP